MSKRPQGASKRLGTNLCPCGSGKKAARCCGQRTAQVASKLALALTHHRNGLLGEAEELYAEILRLDPQDADALHFSGLVAHQQGRSEIGIDLMLRAIQREPGRALFFRNLGHVLEATGDLEKATLNYRAAASLDADLEPAHRGLADVLLKQGNIKEAAASYHRALSLKPDSPETINNLGNLLQKIGKLDQSVVCYRKAISIKPDYAEAHNNLGNVLKSLGMLPEAIASFEQAAILEPDLAAAHCNLGGMLLARGDFNAALIALHRALELEPNLSGAHSNLGVMLLTRGDFDGALKAFQRALELEPNLSGAHLNLGSVYKGQGLLSQAVCEFQRAISLAPDSAAAYNNLALTYLKQDNLDDAVEAFQKVLAGQSDIGPVYSNLLCLYSTTRHISPEAERAAAEGWEKLMLTGAERAAARERGSVSSGAFAAHSRAGRRLRLGIISADLGNHAVAEFLQPFLEQLDRSRLHITLFPTYRRFGPRSLHLQNLADSVIPLTEMSDSRAADRVREEKIDVLIETTGHTFGGRPGICAHRAAPVQCSYIGYWSTTGLSEMDWIFADPFFPRYLDAHFTEGVWRLPRFAACYRGDPLLPESGWIPDPDGTIWLGSFNKYGKIRRDTLCLWAKVLCALPEAKLLLEDRGPCEEQTHRRILATLLEQGVSAERVTFVAPIHDHQDHMILYDRLDIALDTIPFNSGTTAFDALWMGVPLVTLEGNWSGGIIGSSVLKAFDRQNWIAQNDEEYVSIVCSLARDLDGRKRLRKTQRSRMAASPLCDANGMARSLEEAWEAMYDAWLAGAQTGPSPIIREEVAPRNGAVPSSSAVTCLRLTEVSEESGS